MWHQPQTADADKYDDAMLMLILVRMMGMLMLTPMMSVGILLEQPHKGTHHDQAHDQPLERPEAAIASASSPHRASCGLGQIHWEPNEVNYL